MFFLLRAENLPAGPSGSANTAVCGARSESRIRPAGLLLAAAALLLSGCGDRVLDTGLNYRYLTGETAPESPREVPVRRMSGADPGYPSLYSVPDRPPPPPGPAERRAAIDRLAADRDAAHAADAALAAMAPQPPPPPAPVPAPASAR